MDLESLERYLFESAQISKEKKSKETSRLSFEKLFIKYLYFSQNFLSIQRKQKNTYEQYLRLNNQQNQQKSKEKCILKNPENKN